MSRLALACSWLVAACLFAFGPVALSAQTHSVSFNADEGTCLSLDIAPSGDTLVFELLGDVYALPTKGGGATTLLTGPAFQMS